MPPAFSCARVDGSTPPAFSAMVHVPPAQVPPAAAHEGSQSFGRTPPSDPTGGPPPPSPNDPKGFVVAGTPPPSSSLASTLPSGSKCPDPLGVNPRPEPEPPHADAMPDRTSVPV